MINKIWFENEKWCTFWVCEECDSEIKCCVSEKRYLNRNVKLKKICKPCSLKKQIGTGNPFYNKTHSQESIDKISKSKTGIQTSTHMGTPKYRKLAQTLANERWGNGSMEKVRVKLSDLMKKRISAGELKSYNRSKAEDEIIEILTNLGIQVTPNYIIDGKIFDIYIPSFNLLIEYNGDYWHCNPLKYCATYYHKKKSKTANEIWEYDLQKLYLAKNKGYLCEVIWETDYKNNKQVINKLIQKYEKT